MTQKKLRFLMDLELKHQLVSPSFEYKIIHPDDITPLGALLWNADQDLEDYKHNTLLQSTEEVKDIIDGKSGPFLTSCSFLASENEDPIAAVMFTFYPKEKMPLLALTMTRSSHKNRGLCQSLLRLSCNALLTERYTKCFLAVDADNGSAIRAYEKVGFKKRANAGKSF